MSSEAWTAERKYEEPRAHAVRERYLGLFGGPELPVPVEANRCPRTPRCAGRAGRGMLLPQERRIVLNAHERATGRDDPPLRRFRFTVAHEIGHWVCHCLSGRAPKLEPSYCRAVDLTDAADRTLEREANVFAAELLMPEEAVRAAWEELGDVEACAARFDVSPTAMQWRLYNLRLVSDAPIVSSERPNTTENGKGWDGIAVPERPVH